MALPPTPNRPHPPPPTCGLCGEHVPTARLLGHLADIHGQLHVGCVPWVAPRAGPRVRILRA